MKQITLFPIIETFQMLKVIRNEELQYRRDLTLILKHINGQIGNIERLYQETAIKEMEIANWRSLWLK
jgi:hypothetical protein